MAFIIIAKERSTRCKRIMISDNYSKIEDKYNTIKSNEDDVDYHLDLISADISEDRNYTAKKLFNMLKEKISHSDEYRLLLSYNVHDIYYLTVIKNK